MFRAILSRCEHSRATQRNWADLKKDFDGKQEPEKMVSVLSNRLHGLYRFNTSWYTLLELSLLGVKIPIDGMAPVYLEVCQLTAWYRTWDLP